MRRLISQRESSGLSNWIPYWAIFGGLEIRKFANCHNVSIDTVREDLKTLAKLGYERDTCQDVIATHRGSEVVWRYIEAVRFLFSNNLHWLANV